jgi:hypothetical protein
MSYTLLSETFPVAKKRHCCIWCGQHIQPAGLRERRAWEGGGMSAYRIPADALIVDVDGIGRMWQHHCPRSGRVGGGALTLPLGELCDRCGSEPPPPDGVALPVKEQKNG